MPEAGAQRTCRGHVLAKSASSQDSSDIVEGLCGANCRHNFFPTWEGVDDVYPKELLEEYTRKDAYSYNGKKMSEYEATQVQRKIERNIRKWQREFITMEAAGQDTTFSSV